MDEVELGYVVRSALWSRGYATEMGHAVASHAFSALGLASLVGFTRRENARSRRVLEQLGFVFERESRQRASSPCSTGDVAASSRRRLRAPTPCTDAGPGARRPRGSRPTACRDQSPAGEACRRTICQRLSRRTQTSVTCSSPLTSRPASRATCR